MNYTIYRIVTMREFHRTVPTSKSLCGLRYGRCERNVSVCKLCATRVTKRVTYVHTMHRCNDTDTDTEKSFLTTTVK